MEHTVFKTPLWMQLDSGAGDLLWPTLQWIFFPSLCIVEVYYKGDTYLGSGRSRAMNLSDLGRW